MSAAACPRMQFGRVAIARSAKVVQFYFFHRKQNRHRVPGVDTGRWPAVEVKLRAARIILPPGSETRQRAATRMLSGSTSNHERAVWLCANSWRVFVNCGSIPTMTATGVLLDLRAVPNETWIELLRSLPSTYENRRRRCTMHAGPPTCHQPVKIMR